MVIRGKKKSVKVVTIKRVRGRHPDEVKVEGQEVEQPDHNRRSQPRPAKLPHANIRITPVRPRLR